jgi:hypothetical protein
VLPGLDIGAFGPAGPADGSLGDASEAGGLATVPDWFDVPGAEAIGVICAEAAPAVTSITTEASKSERILVSLFFVTGDSYRHRIWAAARRAATIIGSTRN